MLTVRESIVERTADRIKEIVKQCDVDSDGKLPNERELAQSVDVSCSSVREALRRLEGDGILEIRPIKGSYVISQESYTTDRFVDWYNQYKPEIFQLIKTRLALEPTAAELAADRITDEQIVRLEQAHEEFVRYIIEGDVLKITHGDETFHDLIFEATHNPILRNLNSVIKSMLNNYKKKVFSIPKEAMKAVSQHDEILRSIKEHIPNAAKEHMVQHLLISKRGLLDAIRSDGC